MNYVKQYENLINKSRQRTLEGYKEVHHIVPKSLGGSDKKENLVELTAREHFIAHLLLVKIHPRSYSMIKSVNMMCCGSNRQDRSMNRMYSWLKEKHSKAQSEKMKGDGNTQFGSMWIHNLDLKESKKIKKGESIPNGWLKGRVINFDKKSKIKEKQPCKKCGELECKRPDVCKKHQMINTLIKFFNFNEETKGSEKFYDEYDRVRTKLENEYYGGLSTIDLTKKYGLTSTQRLDSIFKSLDIKPKTHSEALKNYVRNRVLVQ